MMASEGIGALLRGIREAAGLTREEQAAVLQAAQGGKWFDPENLKRWETEKRLPTPMWHALLAECYGRSAEEIVRAVVVSRRRRRLHRLIDEGAREE
ncbi:helix-turn-helix domain-containing protein, partial [Streptomyces sp. DSM 41982]